MSSTFAMVWRLTGIKSEYVNHSIAEIGPQTLKLSNCLKIELLSFVLKVLIIGATWSVNTEEAAWPCG